MEHDALGLARARVVHPECQPDQQDVEAEEADHGPGADEEEDEASHQVEQDQRRHEGGEALAGQAAMRGQDELEQGLPGLRLRRVHGQYLARGGAGVRSFRPRPRSAMTRA